MDWAAILRLNFGTFYLMWVFQKISQQVCHWIALLAYTWWKQSGQLFDWHPLQLGIWEWVLPCCNFDAQLIYYLQVSCLSTPWLAGMCSLMKHGKCLQKCSTPTVSTILRHTTCMGSCSGHATTTSTGVKVRVVLRVELRGWVIEVRTYLIFKLKYLHDMSEVFILNNRINKRINQRTNTSKVLKKIQSIYGEQGVCCTQNCNVQSTRIVKYKDIYKMSILVN